MNNTLRIRNQVGQIVIWKRTGTNNSSADVGDWNCRGCGETGKSNLSSRARSHAKSCDGAG